MALRAREDSLVKHYWLEVAFEPVGVRERYSLISTSDGSDGDGDNNDVRRTSSRADNNSGTDNSTRKGSIRSSLVRPQR